MTTDARRAQVAAAQARYVQRKGDEWREAHARVNSEWGKRNREKTNAHTAVWRAVKKGLLVKPDACVRCGKEGPVEGSHDDYSKPLEVEWLCRKCHANKDRKKI